ncbi:hypothetical protein BRADI_3g38682v3, partial [Brachypodium distachyon]
MDSDDPRHDLRGRAPAPALPGASGGATTKKSGPGQPWSHAETMHLLDVYEDRWNKLRRGQLKAQQWEDVAAETTARCVASGAGAGQRKTGTQCRHKLEKLRKRYRAEAARPVASLWPFFRRMDQLERGPRAALSPPAAASDDEGEEEEEEEEEGEEDDEDEEGQRQVEEPELVPRNSKSINGILRDGGGGFRGFTSRPPQPQQPPPPSPCLTLSNAPPRKRVAYEAFQAQAAADRVKAEEAQADRSGAVAHGPFSDVLRDFGEGLMRLERRRMDVQWEIERGWKEVEARHSRMLQDAQRRIQDTIAAVAASASGKKARRDHGSSGDDDFASQMKIRQRLVAKFFQTAWTSGKIGRSTKAEEYVDL